ncbi:DUF349 domain-containing protein [Tunicatimonas pelagia]|uniref:DUF349 domain-containing protein n=1 Tax=Tunicatimonas pelagia TaxID=931531 RepID=UPI0026665822|nr:DUF349 domain-containing protein [Tunicatimonas pelagia]WKN42663.1 DUF349 domain-containing protein [Tunicatimonas pelagia]
MAEASEDQKDKKLSVDQEPENTIELTSETTTSSEVVDEESKTEVIVESDSSESTDVQETPKPEISSTSEAESREVLAVSEEDKGLTENNPNQPLEETIAEATEVKEPIEAAVEADSQVASPPDSEPVSEVSLPEEKLGEDEKENKASEEGQPKNQEQSAGEGGVVSAPSAATEEAEVDNQEASAELEEEENVPDYSQLSREELAREMERLAKGDEVNSIADQVRELKVHFDDLEETERQQALERFIKDGGEADGFEYRPDEFYTLFYAAYDEIRERRSEYRNKREKSRQENLKEKEEILNKLRDFVDSEETQVSIAKVKEIQQQWRSIGEVPSAQNRTLWANYHALLDRFYDNRSIYFELKELDRKKNLESKIAVAERAEQLVEEPDIKKAAKELDELHEEYKHIGPVPRDDQEALWQRFKAASDKIHDRRREDIEAFKEQLKQNLAEKLKLVEAVTEFASFESDSIKAWNKKTKELQQLQKSWEAAGSMPRNQAKEINRQFWSSFKEFFAHKGAFFQRLDAHREENLQKKEALAEKAESLKESEDWKTTSNELKRLQREWKDIGPVPEKARESIYQRFKAACDAFFERRRNNSQETEVEYQKNLAVREEVCDKIEALAKEKSSDLDALTKLIQQYAETGFVPRSAMKSISTRYQQAVNQFVENAEELDENQKKEVLIEIELGSMKSGPGGQRKVNLKESSIRRKISQLESDISLWRNNISFFTSSSKQASKLIADVERKIEKATAEVEQLKSQLAVLRSLK